MEKKDLINEENYNRINKKLFHIQIILLFVWLFAFIVGIVVIILAIRGYIWTVLPGVGIILLATFGIGSVELMLFFIRHQRSISAYQAATVAPIINEFADETSEAQKKVASNMAEGFRDGMSKSDYCFCTECGAKNFAAAKFCSSCGREIQRIK